MNEVGLSVTFRSQPSLFHLILSSFLSSFLSHIIHSLTGAIMQPVLSAVYRWANSLRGGHIPAGDPPCPNNVRSAAKLLCIWGQWGCFPWGDWEKWDSVNQSFSRYHLMITVEDNRVPRERRKKWRPSHHSSCCCGLICQGQVAGTKTGRPAGH